MKFLNRMNLFLIVLALFFTLSVSAVPLMINYQGKVDVGGTPFNDTGLFRFAIVNATGAVQYWSNDGNDPPATDVALSVTDGLFNVMLGDPDVIDAIPVSVFDHDEIYLRVWFNDGTAKDRQLLSPDQRITSVGFVVKAAKADDADTVDGVHASDLEESAEIDSKIAAHAANASAHHVKTTHFSELTDTATDAQIPDTITIAHAATSGDADTIDGHHYDGNWPTTQTNIRAALGNDFHTIGGADDDQPDDDSEVPDNVSINNGTLHTIVGQDNVGIGITNPGYRLHVDDGALKVGNGYDPAARAKNMIKIGDADYIQIGEWEQDDQLSFKASSYSFTNNSRTKFDVSGIPEYNDNTDALNNALPIGGFYRTGDVLKVVHGEGIIRIFTRVTP